MFKREKIIKKMKVKKLNGNISLLVILVLLASSVIALLSINQIQHLMTYGNMTFNYFRSYYLAKAGTELGLTELYNRDSGFENMVESGDAIVNDNLVGNYVAFNPYFTMDIESNFDVLTDDIRFGCENGNKIELLPGDGVVIPLFKDETQGTKNILNPTIGDLKGLKENEIRSIKFKDNNPNNLNLIFGYFVFKGQDMYDIEVVNGSDLESFLNSLHVYDGDKKYLTIKNPPKSGSAVEFCIEGGKNQKLSYSDAIITVRGNYANMEVGLQSVVKRQSPSWSLNVLGDVNL